MKTITLLVMLLLPLSAFADKYEDATNSLRDVLLAMSQISVQGKDAYVYSQIQQGLSKMSKDISDLQKENKAAQEEVMACKKEQDTKVTK